MTGTPGLSVSELRAVVAQALERTADGLEGGYAALMRSQLRTSEADAACYGPAVLCLGIGVLSRGDETKTLPPATALALLEEMARVFIELEARPPPPLVGAWGMPRSLNAGDGFYAAAQDVLLTDQGLPPAQRLAAAGMFSAAARAFSEALQAAGPGGREAVVVAARSLYPVAVALAAVCAGIADADAVRLSAIAADLATHPGSTLSGALQKAAALNLQHA
jgi:hypothetical protein